MELSSTGVTPGIEKGLLNDTWAVSSACISIREATFTPSRIHAFEEAVSTHAGA